MADQRGPSRTGGEGQDNVVQLPRDWLGPREELVPFGPRAWEQDAPPDLLAEENEAVAPDDFWGENSESLHTAVRGPVTTPAVGPSRAGGDGAPQGVAPATGPMRRSVRSRSSLRIAVVAAVAVAMLGGFALLVLGGGSRPAPSPIIAAGVNADVLVGHLSSTGEVLDAGVHRLASLRMDVLRPRRPARRPHHTADARPAGAAGAGSGRGAAPSEPVQAVQPYSPPSTATSASAPATATPAGSSGESGAGVAPSSSSASNQPAFGANGTLGPGSSPNG